MKSIKLNVIHPCVLAGVLALVFLAFARPVPALINPDFTPIHLSKSDSIFVVKVKDFTGKLQLEVTDTLKGKAPAKLVVDLDKAGKDQAEAARKQLKALGTGDALFFGGQPAQNSAGDGPQGDAADQHAQADVALLHVHGVWLHLSRDGEGYSLDAVDDKMLGTWNGSSEMLRRCIKYILEDDTATVPVDAGMNWAKANQVAKTNGNIRDLQAVDVAGNGKLLLFIASDKGDMLLRAGDETFENVTDKVKLKSSSLLATWGNFSGSGRLDLASYDGKSLTLWVQAADGTFAATKPGGNFKLPEKCLSMTTIALGTAKTPGLLFAGAAGAPVLLKPLGGNAFESVSLPEPSPQLVKAYGAAQGCLVADFLGHSFVDVIQPYENGGLLYSGNKDGFFDAPQACGVAGSTVDGKSIVGDFDGSGRLEVVLAGSDGVHVCQNLGSGKFASALDTCGEVSVKAQANATCCTIGDFNNDSRQDVIFGYANSEQGLQVYFNRGFHSFGEAPKLELNNPPTKIEGLEHGPQGLLLADLRGVGVQDLLVVLDGTLWCAYNSLADEDPLCIKVKLSAKSALTPINVMLYKGDRCLGVCQVRCGIPAFFGMHDKGQYTLKWTLPGGKEMSRTINVERPIEVLLETAEQP